ncbi:MAG TPA: methyltransferase domain-containing protein [Anaerolineae bacterium]|nr:methyltransferase domain-containing protein [Anaerolineae bacterium]HQI83043.1 methyltransferase domain-containing protein [Anaerolineae bacterium]
MTTPQDVLNAVQNLYRSDAEREWQRMDRHRTEFAVTLRALDAHLPPAPAHVLDCGGGPGRYAIALAQRGYDVTLFDLSPDLLALAREKAAAASVTLRGFEQGTATDLSRFADGSFDAVLLMGPLYHLLDEAERRQALAEAYRVVKPGRLVCAAFITRYAAHRDAAARYPEQAFEEAADYRNIAQTGLLPPRADGAVAFTAYFAHPAEVTPLCRSVGLDVDAVLGVEGVASAHETLLNALEGAAWDFWVDVNYEIAHDPAIHGGAEHLLAVCRKPRWRTALRQIVAALDAAGIAYRVVGGTSLALRGLPVPVNDIDLEMAVADAYRCQDLFAAHVVEPVAFRQGEVARSHIGRFTFDGVRVEIMAELHWRKGNRWVPSFLTTRATVDLDGAPVSVLELEEEALAYLRRGRLERLALCLPHCDPERFHALFQNAIANEMF